MIELMIAIAVMAVLLGVAVPAFQDAGLNSRLRALSSELVATANLARSEAIKRNALVSMCVSANGTACTSGGWEQGWIIITDTTVIKRVAAGPSGFEITPADSVATITFQPTGVGATVATLTVCRAAPSAGDQERLVSIDAAGRASVRKTNTGVCPG